VIKLDASGHATRTLAGNRTYLLHVPPEYDGRKALPVVLSFHGGES
jgi:poly(3-hydroxybutyrate) depolymerase